MSLLVISFGILNFEMMLPRFKVSDVVFLHEDCKEEVRKKYKIIEIYPLNIPPVVTPKTIRRVVKSVIRRRNGLVENNAAPDYEYLVEPLTDGAGRRVKEGDIEGETD